MTYQASLILAQNPLRFNSFGSSFLMKNPVLGKTYKFVCFSLAIDTRAPAENVFPPHRCIMIYYPVTYWWIIDHTSPVIIINNAAMNNVLCKSFHIYLYISVG